MLYTFQFQLQTVRDRQMTVNWIMSQQLVSHLFGNFQGMKCDLKCRMLPDVYWFQHVWLSKLYEAIWCHVSRWKMEYGEIDIDFGLWLMSISDQYQSMTCINGCVFCDVWDWHGVVLVHVDFLMSVWLISVWGYGNLWWGDRENELWMSEEVLVVFIWESKFYD